MTRARIKLYFLNGFSYSYEMVSYGVAIAHKKLTTPYMTRLYYHKFFGSAIAFSATVQLLWYQLGAVAKDFLY